MSDKNTAKADESESGIYLLYFWSLVLYTDVYIYIYIYTFFNENITTLYVRVLYWVINWFAKHIVCYKLFGFNKSVSEVKSNRPLSNKTVRENNPLLKQLLFDNPSDNDAGSDITFQFPLQTVSVLFEIEDKLKNDSSAYKCLVVLINCLLKVIIIYSECNSLIYRWIKCSLLLDFQRASSQRFIHLWNFSWAMNWLQRYQCLERIQNYVFVRWSCMRFYTVSLTFIYVLYQFQHIIFYWHKFFSEVLLKHIPEVTAKTLQSPIQCWLYNASRRLLQKQAISQNSVSFKNIKF